jgi:tetratricopeptide (TPR) repeat protein
VRSSPEDSVRGPNRRALRRAVWHHRAVFRLAFFFLAALVLTGLLRELPYIGAIFQVPILGFWVTAILLAGALTYGAQRLVVARRLRNRVRDLGIVDRPANQGKLGALLLASGRAKDALSYLEAAHVGEPERAEWAYRLGETRLALGDTDGALAALDPLLARDEEHAYGRALLLSARAARTAGRPDDALARLARLERGQGPTPEGAFEQGLALRDLGRADEARAAFRDVPRLAAEAGRFRQAVPRRLVWRARLAQLR